MALMNKDLKSLLNRIIRKNNDEKRKQIEVESKLFLGFREAVKKNPAASQELVEYLLNEAAKTECRTRQLALSLIDYFFHRSHVWRLAVVDNLKAVLNIFCELDILHQPLPLPKEDADELKVDAIKRIKIWHEKFADGYERLRKLPEFLATSKSMDFKRASASILADRQRDEEQKRKKHEAMMKVATNIMDKFSAMKGDMSRCLTEVSSAIDLLVPNFLGGSSEGVSGENQPQAAEIDQRAHGQGDNPETISIYLTDALPKVKLSKETEALTIAVSDGDAMLSYYQKQLVRWLNRLSQVGAKQEHVLPLIHLKARIDAEKSRVADLSLPSRRALSSDEDESDFEDVPEKEVEEFENPQDDSIPLIILKKLERDANPISTDDCDDRPGTSKSSENQNEIPTLPYGLDLKYWGQEIPTDVEVPRNDADSHRFWRAPDDEGASKEQMTVYTTRQMTFLGKGIKAERACRARLANGKLCPREDVRRCPLHGLIIERDDEGFPINEVSDLNSMEQGSQNDQELLRDIEEAIGKKLGDDPTSPKKARTWGQKNREIPQSRQTRDRLQKKLLDKRAIIRISAHLDAVRKAKIEKNFGHQFTHALSRK